MAPRTRSRAKKEPAYDGEDRLSALPDGVLQHVLGFLLADEAVRTCVLARHWRHQWRSVRRLRIDCNKQWSNEDFVRFVNRLLLLRAPGMALDEFELSSDKWKVDPEVEEGIYVWIRHALMYKVQALIIDVSITLDTPLISQHLRRLKMDYVDIHLDCLDFVTCPALEVLDLTYAGLYCSRIVSQSLKHVQIGNCSFAIDIRTCISMPSLISLQLNNFLGKAPLLEFMPSLQTAFVKPTNWGLGMDTCMKNDDPEDDCCGICASCCGEDDQKGRCVLLGGLSNATYLELIACHGTIIFKRDLRWCPTFAKLKTLLLNEWCVAIDLAALVCILEHSPVLEKLILQISQDRDSKTEPEGRNHDQMERVPKVSECLKLVEIKCKKVGSLVCEIKSFLSRFTQVKVMRVTRTSHFFSFENRRCKKLNFNYLEGSTVP